MFKIPSSSSRIRLWRDTVLKKFNFVQLKKSLRQFGHFFSFPCSWNSFKVQRQRRVYHPGVRVGKRLQEWCNLSSPLRGWSPIQSSHSCSTSRASWTTMCGIVVKLVLLLLMLSDRAISGEQSRTGWSYGQAEEHVPVLTRTAECSINTSVSYN